MCGKCGDAHKSEECTSETIKCINCVYAKEVLKMDVDVQHYSWSFKCPVYERKQMGLLNRNQFTD